jgi:predicted nucleotidyltransferase
MVRVHEQTVREFCALAMRLIDNVFVDPFCEWYLTLKWVPSIIKRMTNPLESPSLAQAPSLQQAIVQLCQQYDVVALYVFGSQATAVWQWAITNQTVKLPAGHDVDIGVKVRSGERLTTMQKVTLAQAIEELLAVPRVDLVCLDDADPFIAVNIIRGERLYVADSYWADEYELYILRRAGDLAPFERARIKMILEGRLI